MEHQELAVSITASYDFPIVTIQGAVKPSNAHTVEDIIDGFYRQDTSSLVLDISRASCPDVESTSALVRAIRVSKAEMRVATIASSKLASVLKVAKLGPAIKVCDSIDEAAQFVCPEQDYYTSRWMASKSNDEELPLAA